MIIAIDGPAAAGKGTLAKSLSKRLSFSYLDTGLLYRAIGKKTLERGGSPDNEAFVQMIANGFSLEDINPSGLRSELIGQAASKLSAYAGVRDTLLMLQRDFAHTPPNGKKGAILDGRDIGTIVCPTAQIKLFITASIEVRAQRRLKELQYLGTKAIYARVLEEMIERDNRDQKRAVAPLEPADDAHIIDTSEISEQEVLKRALKIISPKTKIYT